MDFKDYLKISAAEIENKIRQVLLIWQKEGTQASPKLTRFADIFTDSCEGGKRLRGTLVKLGYQLAGGKADKEILGPAAGIEIFQTAILAHDDIIDLSPTRRGKPTIYRQLGGDHYGISQTICIGDAGLFLACRLIIDSNFDDSYKNKASSIFCQMMINTIYGEMLDVELPHSKVPKTEADVLAIHRLKTAFYTIVHPMTIGAVLAGREEKLLEKIEIFGENLGIAFQIQDDILGVFSDEQTLGKSVTSDIEEGKNTTLITKALEEATPDQKKVLDSYYGKGGILTSQIEQVKKVFIDTGALDYSRQLAVQYVNRAKEIIPQLTDKKEYQQLLTEMADFLVERTK